MALGRSGIRHADPVGPSDREAALKARIDELEQRLEAAEAELEVLKHAPDQFVRLVELVPDAVMVHDRAWRVLYLNRAAVAQFGLRSAEEAIGRNAERFVDPSSRDAVAARSRAVARGEKQPNLVQRRLRADGGSYLASASAAPIDWHGIPATVVVIRDITEQQSNAELARAAATRLHDAIEAMSEGIALFDRDERLVEVNRRYREEIFPSVGAWIAPGMRFEDIARRFWQAQYPAGDARIEAAVQRALQAHRLSDGQWEMNLADGRIVRAVKRHTADGGTVGVYADVTEARRHEAALKEVNERHRRVLDMLPDPVFIHCDGRFVYVNAAAVRLYGAESADALIGRSNLDFVPPEYRESMRERMRHQVETGEPPPPMRQQRLRMDGTRVDVDNHARVTTWNGRPAWIIVMRDIGRRLRSERTLEETQRRLLAITANLPGAVYQRVMYPDGRVEFPYVSDGVRDTHGLVAAEIMADARGMMNSLHPDDRNRFYEALRASGRDLSPFEMELRNIRPDGQIVWTHSIARPHRREDGAIVWDGIFFDITAQKEAEERAAQSHRWLLDAIDSIPEGFALWDRDGRLVVANRNYYTNHEVAKFPIGPGTPIETFARWRARNVYGVDDDAAAEAWVQTRLSNFRAANEPFEIHGKNGRWTFVNERKTSEGFTVGLYTDITRRKRREQALQESEARYRGLVELMPDLVYVVLDGKFAFVNSAGARLLGAESPDELIGRETVEFTHPDHVPAIRARYGQVLSEGVLITPWECRRRRLDGSEFWTENIARQIVWQGKTASLVIARDITAQVQAKEALRDSEATLKALINASPDIAMLLDRKRIVLAINDAGARYFGHPTEEIVGRRARDFTRREGREERDAAIARATETGQPVELEQQWKGRWLHSTFCPILDAKGQLQREAIFIRDVTVAREAAESMRQAKEAAEVANRSKSEFLANMSHELRTPLNAIIGFSEIMMTEMFGPLGNENYLTYARDVHESGTHLLQVINDILDLSKIEAGRMSPNLVRVDPRIAVESSIRIVKPRADSRGLQISTRIPPGAWDVEADERILKQILMNLLSNSVKFTRGGGRIGVRARRTADGMVALTVVDTGIGIAPADMARVMQPFGQVDSTLSRKFQGTGLGLPLTKSLVELLGGSFTLWSKPDFGTVATVRLPAWR